MKEEKDKKNEEISEKEEDVKAPEEKTKETPEPDGKKASKKDIARLQKESDAAKKELAKAQKEIGELKEQAIESGDRYVRMMAEYENYRKRAASEKDAAYNNALTDVLTQILPLRDALEMALKYGPEGDSMRKGVEMTLTKFDEVFEKLGVVEVETKTFDPNLHNAVMHIEDENLGEGEIVEVFQKGYKKGDKIIRYAMVKVAN